MLRPPPSSTLFPYTTLFRSDLSERDVGVAQAVHLDAPHVGLEQALVRVVEERDERCVLERSEEHTSELQSPYDLVCRLLLEKKKTTNITALSTHRCDVCRAQ